MSTLSVAVVGAGAMGERHARAVSAAGDDVSVVIDRLVPKAETLASSYGAEVRDSLDGLTPETIDAAVVTTPTADHHRTARTLLDRGIPVLVEKPHRMPSQDPWESRADGPLCWVGVSTRYSRGMSAVRTAIQSGVLGDIVLWSDRIWFELRPDSLPAWYFDPQTAGGGVLVTNGVHALDRVEWMLGPLEIESSHLSRVIEEHATEDLATVIGRAGETRVEISLLWAGGALPPPELVVVGTKGTASVRQGRDWEISSDGLSEKGHEVSDDEPFEVQWKAFRNALLSGDEGGPTPERLERGMDRIRQIYNSQEGHLWT